MLLSVVYAIFRLLLDALLSQPRLMKPHCRSRSDTF